MIVSRAELALITNSRMRRRMMRLPARRYRAPKVGRLYKLAARDDGDKAVQVTVSDVRMELLSDLSSGDARKEGYATVQGALAAWEQRYGRPARDERVFVVAFVVGDARNKISDQPVFLSKYGDFTTLAARQAVPGDPELCVLEGAGEHARVMELARRQEPLAKLLDTASREIGEMKQAMLGMKARQRMRLIERELGRLRDELPVQSLGVGGLDAAVLGSIPDTDSCEAQGVA